MLRRCRLYVSVRYLRCIRLLYPFMCSNFCVCVNLLYFSTHRTRRVFSTTRLFLCAWYQHTHTHFIDVLHVSVYAYVCASVCCASVKNVHHLITVTIPYSITPRIWYRKKYAFSHASRFLSLSWRARFSVISASHQRRASEIAIREPPRRVSFANGGAANAPEESIRSNRSSIINIYPPEHVVRFFGCHPPTQTHEYTAQNVRTHCKMSLNTRVHIFITCIVRTVNM